MCVLTNTFFKKSQYSTLSTNPLFKCFPHMKLFYIIAKHPAIFCQIYTFNSNLHLNKINQSRINPLQADFKINKKNMNNSII